MTKRFKSVIFLVFSLAAMLVFTGGVQAEEPDLTDRQVVERLVNGLLAAEDQELAFNQLTPAEQQAVMYFLTPANIRMESDPPVGFNSGDFNAGCKTHIRTALMEGGFGNDLAELESSTYFCWDGAQISTDPFFTVTGRVHISLYQFLGIFYESESGGQGHWDHRDYVQGHFRGNTLVLQRRLA